MSFLLVIVGAWMACDCATTLWGGTAGWFVAGIVFFIVGLCHELRERS